MQYNVILLGLERVESIKKSAKGIIEITEKASKAASTRVKKTIIINCLE